MSKKLFALVFVATLCILPIFVSTVNAQATWQQNIPVALKITNNGQASYHLSTIKADKNGIDVYADAKCRSLVTAISPMLTSKNNQLTISLYIKNKGLDDITLVWCGLCGAPIYTGDGTVGMWTYYPKGNIHDYLILKGTSTGNTIAGYVLKPGSVVAVEYKLFLSGQPAGIFNYNLLVGSYLFT